MKTNSAELELEILNSIRNWQPGENNKKIKTDFHGRVSSVLFVIAKSIPDNKAIKSLRIVCDYEE